MKLKTIEKDGVTYAEVKDGQPVYVHQDGKEVPFDAPATVAKIGQLNGEARSHREAKEAAELALKKFEGITDPAAAAKALSTVKNLDDKKLVDAGEVEKVKAEAIKAVEEQYKPIVAENEKLKFDLYGEKIGGSFSRSKYIADKIAIPADFMRAQFERNFRIEDGKTVAYDPSGNKIYSRSKPGELAEFEEAIELLVETNPFKDHILKGSGGNGGGAKPANGQGATGAKQMTRAQFDALDANAQMKAMTVDQVQVVD